MLCIAHCRENPTTMLLFFIYIKNKIKNSFTYLLALRGFEEDVISLKKNTTCSGRRPTCTTRSPTFFALYSSRIFFNQLLTPTSHFLHKYLILEKRISRVQRKNAHFKAGIARKLEFEFSRGMHLSKSTSSF